MNRADDLHQLAAAYALDALDAEERAAFEAHYPTCPTCRVEVDEFRQVAAALAEGAGVAPPPALKDSVMAEVGRTRQASPVVTRLGARREGVSRTLLAAAAAVLLLVGALIVLNRPASDPTSEVVSANDAVVATLDATGEGQEGMIQVVWSDERDQVAIIGTDLVVPGDGFAYALWFLLDDGVAPAGLFTTDDGAVSVVLDVDDIDTTGWGITIEPDTGSPQPTGPVLYAATI